MLHRIVALVVAFLTIAVVLRLRRPILPAVNAVMLAPGKHSLSGFAYVLGALLILQILLGMANVLLLLPMWTRVMHLTLGAVFWSAVVMLWTVSRPSSAAEKLHAAV